MSHLLPLIYKKRDGLTLTQEEIESFVQSLASKKPPPDYQIASLLAFIFSKGMNELETATLTQAMRMSGLQFDYKNFPKGSLFVDKHSTGGVGDKITLALAPLVAACDERLHFPTIAGRGLGHTGGTVDKLESIPGLKTSLSLSAFYKILKKHRACFLSQTKEIVPADQILYALRDVTGTVENIPLMTASILSKKLSETLNFLILDLKYGNGAFLTDMDQTEKLAESLISVARDSNLRAQLCMTRMDTPLGHYSGNRLEVAEAIAILKEQGPEDSTELTKDFTRRILQWSGKTLKEADHAIEKALHTGAAFKKFVEVVEAQGGSVKAFEKAHKSVQSKLKTFSFKAPQKGYLFYDVRKLGLALVELEAGRKRKEDKIDPDVGFYHPLEAGTRVEANTEILRVYYKEARQLAECKKMLESAIQIKSEFFPKSPLIRKVLTT
ncbi:MAG: thymidine phosphorylase [Deltaproteobacteria bacterium]|nr:thymidine phosphorylase [Deltaproteobacteria bacterium]